MAESKDLANLTANLYAHELVKFVARHHGIEWNSIVTHEWWENVTQIFHEDVGKIVVAYAKSTEKDHLIRTGEALKLIKSHGQYEVYCIHFRDGFFRNYGHAPQSILKYFTYVIEHSILIYTLGLEDAPLIAVDMISNSLLHVNSGRFVMSGGLNELNESATGFFASTPFLRSAYGEGTFAWCNAR